MQMNSLVDIIVERVIRGVGQENTKSRTEGEEDLCRCIHPHFSFINRIKVWAQIVHDAH